MGTLAKRYKKYANGSDLKTEVEKGTGVGQGAALVGSVVDALTPADQYGKRSGVGNVLGGIGKGVAMGSTFGPVGSIIGGAAGLVGGFLSNGAQKKRADSLRSQEIIRNNMLNDQQSAARVSADPSIVNGNLAAQYYANGGPLNVSNQQTQGGDAVPLNESAAEFHGPSHAEGGIQIPGLSAEVEGNETTNGSYVFSDKLGFARLHKPIAKAIGIIEKKALSPERVTSIKLMKEKEHNLQLSQEFLKQKLGLN